MQKERDSKPLVNNKSDIGKWPGLGPTIRISGSLQIGVSYWRDYNVVCMQQIYTTFIVACELQPKSSGRHAKKEKKNDSKSSKSNLYDMANSYAVGFAVR